jgi:CMP-2-keto-3-deoxyoctulosonic acid synthetase
MPFSRDLGLTVDDAWVAANPCFKHLGLYAYQADFLEKFAKLPPGRYEQIEKLEQLRALGKRLRHRHRRDRGPDHRRGHAGGCEEVRAALLGK